jgi:hypothetical protein
MPQGGSAGDPTLGGRKDPDELMRAASPAGVHPPDQPVPHPERVSDAYADERVREKIGMYADSRPRHGLEAVNEDLKRAGVPPAWRLHYITAVAHLGRVGAETLGERIERSARD